MPLLSFAQESEYTIKAVCLEKFTRFIEWPKKIAVEDTTNPFIMGVIGNNPFGPILERRYSRKKIRNKNVIIRYIKDLLEIDGCHLIFISRGNEDKITSILNYVKDKSILTVSDTPGFADKGVHINLYIFNKNIQFEINEGAVEQSGLYMNFLLKIHAKVVNPLGVRE
jgi:hypothetical protein